MFRAGTRPVRANRARNAAHEGLKNCKVCKPPMRQAMPRSGQMNVQKRCLIAFHRGGFKCRGKEQHFTAPQRSAMCPGRNRGFPRETDNQMELAVELDLPGIAV